MRKMRARKAKGRQAHLGACTMPRVTLEEHPARRWWRKHHCAGHEGQQQREQGGLVWLPTNSTADRLPCKKRNRI